MHKQHIYRNAIVKLDAQRSDIKVQANGTVINAPRLGSFWIGQLVLSGTGTVVHKFVPTQAGRTYTSKLMCSADS